MCQLRLETERERERKRGREIESRTKRVDRTTIHNKHSNNTQISMNNYLRLCRRVRKFEKRETNGEFA
jgi:uncharacterized Zn finger protein (UPF0148 family)